MMKGYLKKQKAKRLLATLLTAVMVFALCAPQSVSAASPTEEFSGGTKIKELLTDYQYVIEGDAELLCHTVGGVLIGGSLYTNNYIGDCTQRASYAKHVESASIADVHDTLGSTRDFYYGTSDLSAETMTQRGFTQKANYVDVASLFPAIRAESVGLYNDNKGTTATSELDSSRNFQMITIDFGTSKAWTIDYEVLKTAKGINIIDSTNGGVFDPNKLSTGEYIINVVNVGGEEVLFDGEAWMGEENSNKIDLFVNNNKSQFLGEIDGAIKGIQCNLSGMKLIWNFPDATGTIKWNAMGGHLVAPSATADVISGRFEGGIIAKSIKSVGQAHFFPYNGYTISSGGDTVVAGNIVIKKSYLLDNGSVANPSEAAKFTLYEDAACTVKVSGAVDVAVDNSTKCVTFNSQSLGLSCGRSYYVKETYAPNGFEIDKETVYECAISVGGQVTYKKVGGDSSYSSVSPVYENMSKTSTEQKGTLVVTVEDIDNNRAKVSGASIKVSKINDDSTKTVIATKTTSTNGVVSYTQLEQGSYEVSIVTIPNGYEAPSEKVVTVNVQTTTYHTFELSQKKEPIVVHLVDSNNNPVSGAYIEVVASDGSSFVQYVGSTGTVTFNNMPSDEYEIILVQPPKGYNPPAESCVSLTVSTSDSINPNEHTFVLSQQVGIVKVSVLDSANDANVTSDSACEVKITYPNGTTTQVRKDADDGSADGIVTFTNVPVGDCVVEVSTAPSDYVLITGSGDKVSKKEVTSVNSGVTSKDLYVKKIEITGNLVISVVDTDTGTNCADTATVKVKAPNGTTTTYTVDIDDAGITLSNQPQGTYVVNIETANGWHIIEATVDGAVDTSSPNLVDVSVAQIANDTRAVVFTVDAVGNLEVVVTEEGTSTPIEDATIVIKDGSTVVKEAYTGTNGKVTVTGLSTGNYTVEVKDVPSGYVKPSGTISATVTQNNLTTVPVELPTTGGLTVTVQEKGKADNKISGAKIQVVCTDTGSSYNTTQTVGSTGQLTYEGLTPGNYKVTIIETDAVKSWIVPTGTDAEKTVVVSSNGVASVVYELEKETADLVVNVVDEANAPVVGDKVVIVIKDSKGNVVSSVVTETTTGTITNTLPVDTYEVTLQQVPEGYVLPDGTLDTKVHTGVNVEVSTGGETTFKLKEADNTQLGALQVNVYLSDSDNSDLSDNPAYTGAVTIKYVPVSGSTANVNCSNTGALKMTKDNLPTGNYTTVLTVPSGYTLVKEVTGNTASQTKSVEANATTVINYVLVAAGNVKVTVKDNDGNLIPGADVVLKDGDKVISTGTTDNSGEIIFEKIPVGDYDVVIQDVPDGYDMPSPPTQDVTVTQGSTPDREFTLPLCGVITAIVYEYGTTDVIEGATVELRNSSDTTLSTKVSDTQGKVTFDNLADGTYKVVITAAPTSPKYAIVDPSVKPSEIPVTLASGARESSGNELFVDALGNLKVTIVEDGTTTGIPNAQVQIKDQNGNIVKDGSNEYFVTSNTPGSEGEILVEDLPKGDYSIKVLTTPSPYKIPYGGGSDTATVEKHTTIEKQVPVAATTTLIITVKDETTGDVLNDDTKGTSQLVVEDQYGEKKEVTTSAGTVTIDNWAVSTPGNPSKVTITRVPDTHIIPTEADKVTTSVEVNKGTETSVDVKAPQAPTQTGDLIITVTDEVKNVKVPDAYVEITYPNGSKEYVYTDSNGKIERPGVIVGEYKITIQSVPTGYTPPSQTVTSIKVVAGPNNVDIIIKKPVITGGANAGGATPAPTPSKSSNDIIAKAPKTGDTGYAPIAVAMMVISMIGFAGVVIYKKKIEREAEFFIRIK